MHLRSEILQRWLLAMQQWRLAALHPSLSCCLLKCLFPSVWFFPLLQDLWGPLIQCVWGFHLMCICVYLSSHHTQNTARVLPAASPRSSSPAAPVLLCSILSLTLQSCSVSWFTSDRFKSRFICWALDKLSRRWWTSWTENTWGNKQATRNLCLSINCQIPGWFMSV